LGFEWKKKESGLHDLGFEWKKMTSVFKTQIMWVSHKLGFLRRRGPDSCLLSDLGFEYPTCDLLTGLRPNDNTLCSLYVHSMSTLCPLYVHSMSTLCPLYVHSMSTLCSLVPTSTDWLIFRTLLGATKIAQFRKHFIYSVHTKDTLDEKGQVRDTRVHVTLWCSKQRIDWSLAEIASCSRTGSEKRLSKKFVWPKRS